MEKIIFRNIFYFFLWRIYKFFSLIYGKKSNPVNETWMFISLLGVVLITYSLRVNRHFPFINDVFFEYSDGFLIFVLYVFVTFIFYLLIVKNLKFRAKIEFFEKETIPYFYKLVADIFWVASIYVIVNSFIKSL